MSSSGTLRFSSSNFIAAENAWRFVNYKTLQEPSASPHGYQKKKNQFIRGIWFELEFTKYDQKTLISS